jgi:DNA polymerase-3 subunit alpha
LFERFYSDNSVVPLIDIDVESCERDKVTDYVAQKFGETRPGKTNILGLTVLTMIKRCLSNIKQEHGIDIDLKAIPQNDERTFRLFQEGRTVGVFQFESTGMKSFLKKLAPKEFKDLIMAIAIYRPGPMGEIDNYIKRHSGKVKIDYIDDSLKDILEDTYCIMIYQEQVMQILSKMGGFTFGEADIVRRAISKKKLNLIEEAKDKFINNSIKNGYAKDKAKEVYDLIVKFADYGFNKSHSVAYSFIAYQMAYLKVHYPEYYYINLLNNNIGGEAKTKE